MLTEISTFGWFGDDPDLLTVSTFGWYVDGVAVGFSVAFAGAGFIETFDFTAAG